MASTFPSLANTTTPTILRPPKTRFDYLEANNLRMTNDGKENIVDDYCALTAATELYRATKKEMYKRLRQTGAQKA